MDINKFEHAPCYLCGYNGNGYYAPSIHPCAAEYHKKFVAERDCIHGHLPRTCEICDLQKRLSIAVEGLKAIQDSLEHMQNASVSTLRCCIEEYRCDGEVFRECATPREWVVGENVSKWFQGIADSAASIAAETLRKVEDK